MEHISLPLHEAIKHMPGLSDKEFEKIVPEELKKLYNKLEFKDKRYSITGESSFHDDELWLIFSIGNYECNVSYIDDEDSLFNGQFFVVVRDEKGMIVENKTEDSYEELMATVQIYVDEYLENSKIDESIKHLSGRSENEIEDMMVNLNIDQMQELALDIRGDNPKNAEKLLLKILEYPQSKSNSWALFNFAYHNDYNRLIDVLIKSDVIFGNSMHTLYMLQQYNQWKLLEKLLQREDVINGISEKYYEELEEWVHQKNMQELRGENIFENLLLESKINEKLNLEKLRTLISKIEDKKSLLNKVIKKFNSTKEFKAKKYFSTIIVLILFTNFAVKNNKWNTYDLIEKPATEIAQKEVIDIKDIEKLIIDIKKEPVAKEKVINPKIFASQENLINEINKIKPALLSLAKITHYDRYDDQILAATENLKAIGENPNPDLLKSIMMIETGMNPRKNRLGYEGFPQTKKHIIQSINKRNGTDFTMADMYNIQKSTEFIHYYLKTINKSKYVTNLEEMIIAYNWGLGNLGEYKNGHKELPNQSKDYVQMIKIFEKYFI